MPILCTLLKGTLLLWHFQSPFPSIHIFFPASIRSSHNHTLFSNQELLSCRMQMLFVSNQAWVCRRQFLGL